MSYIEMYNKSREYFLGERSKQEILISQWADKLKTADPAILSELDISADISLDKLIPELYAEHPNKEVYEEQYSKACELFCRVNDYVDKCNKAAILALEEYKLAINK